MKKRNILIVLAVLLLAAFALGASGAVTLFEGTHESERQAQGNLIGVLVTTEPLDLFDFEAYFNDHAQTILAGGEISAEDADAYTGRLYASLEGRRYVFPDVDGFRYFVAEMEDDEGTYTSFTADDVFNAVKNAIHATDAGESVELEATIDVCDDSGLRAFYINPVYQEESGAVYTTSGHGTSMGGELTGSHTTTLTDTRSSTVNGETTELTSSVAITISYVPRTAETTISQFSARGELIRRETFALGEVPETIETEQDADYLIVETRDVYEDVTRKLVEREEGSLSTFVPRADGICEWRNTSLIWPQAAE